MTEFLLDTNVLITLLSGRVPKLVDRIKQQPLGSLAASSVVVHELYFGAFKSEKVDFNLETLRLLFAPLVILDFDRDDARMAGMIRASLAKQGRPIGAYDVLIAGQARARGLPLVTNNTAEFARVDGLLLEDWTR